MKMKIHTKHKNVMLYSLFIYVRATHHNLQRQRIRERARETEQQQQKTKKRILCVPISDVIVIKMKTSCDAKSVECRTVVVVVFARIQYYVVYICRLLLFNTPHTSNNTPNR